MPSFRLGVNVDHVATVREARGTSYPDPVEAAIAAERGGAEGITVHLREDRRHIQEHDVIALSERISSKLNLEMALSDEIIAFACKLCPPDVCVVPEKREELTTEGGLSVAGREGVVADAVARLAGSGIRVSLFIEPEQREIEAAAAVGAPVVELHTGAYADAADEDSRNRCLEAIVEGARIASDLGLMVNGGHGLTTDNVEPVAAIPEIVELNIGHSIVARALMVGMERATREILEACLRARKG